MEELETSFIIFDKRIYINTQTGSFSFGKSILDEQGYIDYQEAIDSFKPSFINICLCISNECNLNCDYCFNDSKDNRKMDPEKAISLIDKMINKFPDCEKYFVDLSGNGEPLLNLKCILKINRFCKEKSNSVRKEILVSFVSNGVLLSPKTVTLLQDEGILFGISLDGNKYTHDIHRKTKDGKPTFDLILNNVKKIKFRNYIGCAVTITSNVFNLVETIDELSLYFSTICIKPVRDICLGLDPVAERRWSEEYQKLSMRIVDDIKNNNLIIIKKLLNGDDFFGKFICRAFLESKTLNRCDAKITRFCFDIDGNVFGCPPASKYKELKIDRINSKKELTKQFYSDYSCKICLYHLFCGGECAIETSFHNCKTQALCLFKQKLIQLAMYVKLNTESSNPKMFQEIKSFCEEKNDRFKKDEYLENFLNSHPNLNFIDGKKQFDEINKRY